MQSPIAERIAKVLEVRRKQLPVVSAELAKWSSLAERLASLEHALGDALRGAAAAKPERDVDLVELDEAARAFRARDLAARVQRCIDALRIVEARLSRPTVNIGVSGQARVGKSTLLQTIAGLSDSQVPTGEGIPVTAVRSRIFHSVERERATITLHTFSTFRDEVLAPYHRELKLGVVPLSIPEFRGFDYGKVLATLDENKHSQVTLATRLRDMQRALPSYEHLLVGGERTIPLEELRPYVAYPTKEQEDASVTERKYLAVRDVRIECRFPHVDVEDLALVDLPGLGELAADAERHHVEGLQHEVDCVLLVKRPVEGMAYWTDADGRAVDLLDDARGAVKRRGDFVFIVVNDGSVKDSLVDALLGDVRRRANEGVDGRHYSVLRSDAKDSGAVYERALSPVLSHLAERLPVMDREVLADSVERCRATLDEVGAALRGLGRALEAGLPGSTGTTEELIERSAELRLDVAQGLDGIVRGLYAQARGTAEDEGFVKAVHTAYEGVRAWAHDGFGKGKDAWVDAALRAMRAENNSSPFAARELNRIRVAISERFGTLDAHFASRVEHLHAKVVSLLHQALGKLLDGYEGAHALRRLVALLDESPEPTPALKSALTTLLELDIRYRSHLHPRVRRALDLLNFEVKDPQTAAMKPRLVVEVSPKGAEQMRVHLAQLAEQAAYETRRSLLEESNLPGLVLHASAEQLEDSLIRTEGSEREFRRLGRSFRDTIWPGVFSSIEATAATAERVKKALRDAEHATDALRGGALPSL